MISAKTKQGNDTIFSCWARYQQAISDGHDAVNGTIGALLENDGSLAINQTVDRFVRNSPPIEIAAYAPLKGLPEFLDLAVTLALGDARDELESIGVHHTATAFPGSGALYLAAANYADRGSKVLLRDRHWGPYDGFLAGCGLEIATYPLLGESAGVDIDSLKSQLNELSSSQTELCLGLMILHNPTGLSLTAEERMSVLRAFVDAAMSNEEVGYTLLIDAAYHLYAKEPHGWAETITDALHDGMEWPANLLITFAISLSKISHRLRFEGWCFGHDSPRPVCCRPYYYSNGGNRPTDLVGEFRDWLNTQSPRFIQTRNLVLRGLMRKLG